jgi:hypothetical protein
MRLHSDGLIKHYIRPPPAHALQTVIRHPKHWNLLLNEAVFHYYSKLKSRRKKELGYHPFNLRGLARLYEVFPNHYVWECEKVQNLLIFVDSEFYRGPNGVFAISYGSMTPGMHTAYCLWRINNIGLKHVGDWIKKDIEHKYDFDIDLLVRNSDDSAFQASTIYNLCVFPNMDMTFNQIPD